MGDRAIAPTTGATYVVNARPHCCGSSELVLKSLALTCPGECNEHVTSARVAGALLASLHEQLQQWRQHK